MTGASVQTRVRELREADPFMSQQGLADVLGVSRQTIIAIERCKYAPSLDLALKIARHFNKPVEEIFSLQGDK